MFDLATAEHEAAHLVVGLALGLRLRKATIVPSPLGRTGIACGYVWFYSDRKYLAQAIMSAAGIIWDERSGLNSDISGSVDLKNMKALVSLSDIPTCFSLAKELLEGRRRLHARVASELCDRDLGPADVERLVLEHN